MSLFDQVQFGEPRKVRQTAEEVIEHNFEALKVTVQTHNIFELNTEAQKHITEGGVHVRYIVDVAANKPVLIFYVPRSEAEKGKEVSNRFSFRNKSLADRINVPSTAGSEVYYRLTPVTSVEATTADGRGTTIIDLSNYVAFQIDGQIDAPERTEEDDFVVTAGNAVSA